VGLFLVAVVLLVFGQTYWHEFINYDDDWYVYNNPQVTRGLTWQGIGWAFTYSQIGHWHPLTWFSHMLDCQLYGLKAGGHHLTNVLLHAVNAVLLFLILRRMTEFRSDKSGGGSAPRAGTLWPSAFVAAVFAIHPLRVESVAWVAERKDVLSGLFFMLTLGAYIRYVRGPSLLIRYLAVLLLFALGLLSKNMLVTLPFVLLLLDYWPLGRLSTVVISRSTIQTLYPLLIEKFPLFLLSVASCIATSLASEKLPVSYNMTFLSRLQNGLVSYVIYLLKTILPVELAIPYPIAVQGLSLWKVAGAMLLLTTITLGVLALRKQRPYLLVGWLWYVGMLVPVSGIVQISYYAYADRYTYLPQIGLIVAVVWAIRDLTISWRNRRPILATTAGGVIAVLMVCASIQTSYWRNSESLWRHTLACIPENSRAHNNLANTLIPQGRFDEAINHYQQALRIEPNYFEVHNNLGNALALRSRFGEAMVQYQEALDTDPECLEAHYNLGDALLRTGRYEAALEHFEKALEINPGFAKAHNKLGVTLLQIGRQDEATAEYEKAIEINANFVEAHYNLGVLLALRARLGEAAEHFRKVIKLKPDYADAHGNLANVLVGQYKLDEAVEQYQRTIELSPNSAQAHYKLGLALEKQKKFTAAAAQYQKALELDPRHLPAHVSLAWLLATCPEASLRDGGRAMDLAQQAVQLSKDGPPEVLDTLAAAYAEAGRFEEAVQTARQALDLPATKNNQPLTEAIQNQLRCYETNSPYRDKP